jgi:hypothetical protein
MVQGMYVHITGILGMIYIYLLSNDTNFDHVCVLLLVSGQSSWTVADILGVGVTRARSDGNDVYRVSLNSTVQSDNLLLT